MDKIARIRQEIERRKELLIQNSKLIYDLILETFIKEYDDLLAFIDTLSEEPDKSLEEAAEEYATEWHENPDGSAWKPYFEVSAIKAFKAGAEWAMHYQEKMIADAYEKGKQEGIRVVRSWESSPGQGGY